MQGPVIASPTYDETVKKYDIVILKEPGDISLVDGDLAMTKDNDLMFGDVPYNALFRLVQHWRHDTPHIQHLYSLYALMIERENEAHERLEKALRSHGKANRGSRLFDSPEALEAWHAHYEEEGAAVSGKHAYPGLIIMLASNALARFKDDLDATANDWRSSGQQFGGHSVGQIITASANGFRHEDEWAKSRPPRPRQQQSQNVLLAALGPHVPGEWGTPGRCADVLRLLSVGGGFEGFTRSLFRFAHEVAMRRRATISTAIAQG